MPSAFCCKTVPPLEGVQGIYLAAGVEHDKGLQVSMTPRGQAPRKLLRQRVRQILHSKAGSTVSTHGYLCTQGRLLWHHASAAARPQGHPACLDFSHMLHHIL